MLCLTRNENKPSKCQDESKTYFQCRMDRYKKQQIIGKVLFIFSGI
jgi:hypothetical protein